MNDEGFVFLKVPKKQAYVECFCHSKVLGLLGGEALVGCVASISQPCLLLKTLNAFLGLFWEQRRWQSCPSPSPITNWGRWTQISTVLPGSESIHTGHPGRRVLPDRHRSRNSEPHVRPKQKEAFPYTKLKSRLLLKGQPDNLQGNTPYLPLIYTLGHFLCIQKCNMEKAADIHSETVQVLQI